MFKSCVQAGKKFKTRYNRTSGAKKERKSPRLVISNDNNHTLIHNLLNAEKVSINTNLSVFEKYDSILDGKRIELKHTEFSGFEKNGVIIAEFFAVKTQEQYLKYRSRRIKYNEKINELYNKLTKMRFADKFKKSFDVLVLSNDKGFVNINSSKLTFKFNLKKTGWKKFYRLELRAYMK